MQWQPSNEIPASFLEIPKRVYRDDPLWIPEDPQQVAVAFSSLNPFFEGGKAWLQTEGNDCRLAGFYTPTLNIDDESVAFFGYWESTNNQESNQRLFREFELWAAKQGAKRIYGPINFSTFGNYRIRLDHFDKGYFTGEPYNPSYYQSLLEQLGYSEAINYYSIFSQQVGQLANRFGPKQDTLALAKEEGFQLQLLTPELWREKLDELYPFVDAIFSENFAYTGIGANAFKAAFSSLSNKFCQHTSLAVLAPDGSLASCLLGFPDYGPLLCQGNENPINPLQLDFKKHFPLLECPTALGKTVGVLPDYRRYGLYTWMLHEYMILTAEHYQSVGAVLMRSGNNANKMANLIFEDETTHIRHYGLFQKLIA
ncbi:hypothetical protein A9Q81_06045 [Gammaproteobacteria bacterium 42_54_T18]|nr:hypothetical protein A9Q81_06045 [Gammaproteobacteria bacterium 42_54_T18]